MWECARGSPCQSPTWIAPSIPRRSLSEAMQLRRRWCAVCAWTLGGGSRCSGAGAEEDHARQDDGQREYFQSKVWSTREDRARGSSTSHDAPHHRRSGNGGDEVHRAAEKGCSVASGGHGESKPSRCPWRCSKQREISRGR